LQLKEKGAACRKFRPPRKDHSSGAAIVSNRGIAEPDIAKGTGALLQNDDLDIFAHDTVLSAAVPLCMVGRGRGYCRRRAFWDLIGVPF
jgi:hypothetical protein